MTDNATHNLLELAQAIRELERAKATGASPTMVAFLQGAGRYHLLCWSALRRSILD